MKERDFSSAWRITLEWESLWDSVWWYPSYSSPTYATEIFWYLWVEPSIIFWYLWVEPSIHPTDILIFPLYLKSQISIRPGGRKFCFWHNSDNTIHCLNLLKTFCLYWGSFYNILQTLFLVNYGKRIVWIKGNFLENRSSILYLLLSRSVSSHWWAASSSWQSPCWPTTPTPTLSWGPLLEGCWRDYQPPCQSSSCSTCCWSPSLSENNSCSQTGSIRFRLLHTMYYKPS